MLRNPERKETIPCLMEETCEQVLMNRSDEQSCEQDFDAYQSPLSYMLFGYTT